MHRRTTPAARPPALGHRWGRADGAAPARTHRCRVRGAARADGHAGDAPHRHLRQPRLPPGSWLLHTRPDRPAGTRGARADGRLPTLGRAGPLGACPRPALPLAGMSPSGAAWRGTGPRSALPGGRDQRDQPGRLLHLRPPPQAPGPRLAARTGRRRNADCYDAHGPGRAHHPAAVLTAAPPKGRRCTHPPRGRGAWAWCLGSARGCGAWVRYVGPVTSIRRVGTARGPECRGSVLRWGQRHRAVRAVRTVTGGAGDGEGAVTVSARPPNLEPWPTRRRTARRSAASRSRPVSTGSATPTAGSYTSARRRICVSG